MIDGLPEVPPSIFDEAAGRAYEIDGLTPRFAALPSHVDGIGEGLRFAHERGLAVIPWGGGTRIGLGNVSRRFDVALDMSGVNRIVDHAPGDLTATVEAGITVSALQESLARHGQFLPIDPPLPARATLGGTLAVGASGPLKWQYGSIRDTVIGMKVVQADGTITRSGGQVVKNVSGYDMSRLHVGALGSLGVIAEVSLKLTPLPVKEATLIAGFEGPDPCLDAALGLFRSSLMPLAITAFDAQSGGMMGIADTHGSWCLAVRLGGRPRTLDRLVAESRAIIERGARAGVEALDADDAAAAWRALSDFGWDEPTRPLLGLRANVTPSGVPQFVEGIEGMGLPGGLSPAIVAHPAHGTVLVSWIGYEQQGDPIPRILGRIQNLAAQAGGRLVVEHAPLAAKAGMDIWGGIGGPESVVRGLKGQYDPGGILNPGRFVGGI